MPLGIGIGLSPILLGGLVAPDAPTNLVATQNGSDVDLTWTDNATNETEYRIYRSSDGVTYSLIDTIAADSTSYTDTAPGSGIWYYKVASANGAGEALSDAATVYVYVLLDQFTTDRAAGAVNGTATEPGPGGNRTVTDTGSDLTITSAQLHIAGGASNFGDPGLWYGAHTRAGGLAFGGLITSGDQFRLMRWGLDLNQSGSIGGPAWQLNSLTLGTGNGASISDVGTLTQSVQYQFVIILSATGWFPIIRGGSEYADWTALDKVTAGADATLYPCVTNYHKNNVDFDDFWVAQLRSPWNVDAYDIGSTPRSLTASEVAAFEGFFPS